MRIEVACPIASVNARMGSHIVSLAALVYYMREKCNLAFYQYKDSCSDILTHTQSHPMTSSRLT